MAPHGEQSPQVETLGAWRRRANERLDAALPGGAARLDVDCLLVATLGVSRAWLYAHADEPLAHERRVDLDGLLRRRERGEPVAYLTGEREFRSRRFIVSPDVLVPRDDTGVLVEVALAALADRNLPAAAGRDARPPRVIDAGTGSGIVAISLALEWPAIGSLLALDRSAAALRIAQRNARALGASGIGFVQCDWLDGIADRSIDLLVANPPYVQEHDPHLAALAHEPRDALVAGVDGLDALRTLARQAARVLTTGAQAWFEHGCEQAAAVRERLAGEGFVDIVTHRDLAGLERVSGGRRR